MADYRAVLQRCQPSRLDACGDPEQPDCAEAGGVLPYLKDCYRVQNVLWRQLFVLDSMLSLLEGQDLESARKLVTQPCLSPPVGGARGRWKALKVQANEGVEQTEELLQSLQQKRQQISDRRRLLEELVEELQHKHQQCEQLSPALQTAQSALQACDRNLDQLRAQSEATLGQLIGWQRAGDQLQEHLSTVQSHTQLHLLSFNQWELSVELRPRPPSNETSEELEPLRLRVSWGHRDTFSLQVERGLAHLPEDCTSGRWSELQATLSRVLQDHTGQLQLLLEIQGLRSRFAIDWRPAQRLLVYLKSASLVCHLLVEEGYPSSGGVQLLSVTQNGQAVDTSGLKRPSSGSSLTSWLTFLCSSPLF